ncbi:MAG TPA: hypothetical protein P5140_05520 [Methanofastidiosum sp.]|nr:hypothetical protein [Methanofastidiosum sp.]
MNKIKLFFGNGGGRIIEWGVLLSLVVYLICLSYNTGKTINRIEVVEKKTDRIENIEQNITDMKADIRWIKEYLEGKYK